MEKQNNIVTIYGEVISNPVFHHKVYNKIYNEVFISVDRLSKNKDKIPILVSDEQMNDKENYIGKALLVIGQFRSYNESSYGKNKLHLHVFVRELTILDHYYKVSAQNSIELEGYLCRKPIYRKTPRGKKIADIMLAVNRPYGKTDYIPCIAWGRNAKSVSNLKAGKQVYLTGRIQSREYDKLLMEEVRITKTAYEVSINEISFI